jgi:NitT/TauT family transport system substrate-binding protein
MRSKLPALILGLAFAGLVAAGCGGDEESAPAGGGADGGKTTVKMASLGVASDAAMMLGEKKGFFDEEGIDLQVESVGAGGAAVAPAVLKGEYDVAGGGIDGAVLGAAKGLPLKIIGNDGAPVSKGTTPTAADDKFTTGLAVKASSDIKSIADLANRKMAAITITGLQYLCIAGAAEKAGVDPKNLKILEIPAPEMLAALEKGRVEAATLVEPFITVARQKGLRIIDDPCVDAIPGAIQAGFFTSEKWAKENPDVAARLSKALVRSNEYANEHPDEVRAVLPEYTKITPGLAKKITLAPYATDGKNTLPEIADALARYKLIEQQPDTQAILTGG